MFHVKQSNLKDMNLGLKLFPKQFLKFLLVRDYVSRETFSFLNPSPIVGEACLPAGRVG